MVKCRFPFLSPLGPRCGPRRQRPALALLVPLLLGILLCFLSTTVSAQSASSGLAWFSSDAANSAAALPFLLQGCAQYTAGRLDLLPATRSQQNKPGAIVVNNTFPAVTLPAVGRDLVTNMTWGLAVKTIGTNMASSKTPPAAAAVWWTSSPINLDIAYSATRNADPRSLYAAGRSGAMLFLQPAPTPSQLGLVRVLAFAVPAGQRAFVQLGACYAAVRNGKSFKLTMRYVDETLSVFVNTPAVSARATLCISVSAPGLKGTLKHPALSGTTASSSVVEFIKVSEFQTIDFLPPAKQSAPNPQSTSTDTKIIKKADTKAPLAGSIQQTGGRIPSEESRQAPNFNSLPEKSAATAIPAGANKNNNDNDLELVGLMRKMATVKSAAERKILRDRYLEILQQDTIPQPPQLSRLQSSPQPPPPPPLQQKEEQQKQQTFPQMQVVKQSAFSLQEQESTQSNREIAGQVALLRSEIALLTRMTEKHLSNANIAIGAIKSEIQDQSHGHDSAYVEIEHLIQTQVSLLRSSITDSEKNNSMWSSKSWLWLAASVLAVQIAINLIFRLAASRSASHHKLL